MVISTQTAHKYTVKQVSCTINLFKRKEITNVRADPGGGSHIFDILIISSSSGMVFDKFSKY